MKSHLITNKKSVSTLSATVIFGLAILFCLIGHRVTLFTSDYSDTASLIKAYLPITSCVLMLVVLYVFPKKGFVISALPFMLAMFAVMISAFELKSLTGYGEIAICLILAVLYCCTVFGAVRHKLFIIALLIVYMVYHIWLVMRIEIMSSYYTFTKLSADMAVLLILTGFIVVLWGATRSNKIDPQTAKIVPPPVPGMNKLGGGKERPASEPEHVDERPQTEKTISVTEEVPPMVDLPNAAEQKMKAVDETSAEKGNHGKIKNFFSRIIGSSDKSTEPTRPLNDSAEEIGLFEEKPTSDRQ